MALSATSASFAGKEMVIFAQVTPEFTTLWPIIDKGGLLAFSFLVVIALGVGWFVPKWAYTELKERCAKFEKLAEEMTALAHKNVTAAEELRTELRYLRERK